MAPSFRDRSSPILAPPAPALTFDERACFVAGPARSGTTLLTALLDGHPDLLVLPEETAYFPTVRTKYGAHSRRAQFDYLTTRTLSNVLFGGACKWGKRDYSHFPAADFRRRFEERAFDPANARRDLLVLLLETYADTLDRPLASVRRWVEKTPANRDHLGAIFQRFPHARLLITLRDPRALLASQIQLEQSRRQRRFSIYLTVRHWLTTARLALALQTDSCPDRRFHLVDYRRLVETPDAAMREVCAFLGIEHDSALAAPTKIGQPWRGNSASGRAFAAISAEPLNRWRQFLTPREIGWVEWHCRPWMEPLGYEPLFARRRVTGWAAPVRGETPREYFKSRLYSLRGHWKQPLHAFVSNSYDSTLRQ